MNTPQVICPSCQSPGMIRTTADDWRLIVIYSCPVCGCEHRIEPKREQDDGIPKRNH